MDDEKVCRLCASKDGILYNLFDENHIYLHYIKKIHRILPIIINEYDPMPKQLCHKCAFKVAEFYDFRLKCLKTQDLFKTNIPWLNQNQPEDGANDQQSSSKMVELVNSSLTDSPSKLITLNNNVSQFSTPIVIDDDDDNENDEECSSNGSAVENTHSVEALHHSDKFESEAQSYAANVTTQNRKSGGFKRKEVWHADNSNIFGKHRKRKKKSCRISRIFSTSSDTFQNLSENGIIDPADIISTQEQGNRMNHVKQVDDIQPKSKTQESKKNTSVTETKLPEGTLVTKIPGMGNIYTCTICRRTFLGAEAILSHDCLHRVKEEKLPTPQESNNECDDVYICDICNKIFPRQVILLAHKKQHFSSYSSSDSEVGDTYKEKRHYRKSSKWKHKRQKEQSEQNISKNDSS